MPIPFLPFITTAAAMAGKAGAGAAMAGKAAGAAGMGAKLLGGAKLAGKGFNFLKMLQGGGQEQQQQMPIYQSPGMQMGGGVPMLNTPNRPMAPSFDPMGGMMGRRRRMPY